MATVTIEQFTAQAQLNADLYMQVLALQHENTQLREQLEEAVNVTQDGE